MFAFQRREIQGSLFFLLNFTTTLEIVTMQLF